MESGKIQGLVLDNDMDSELSSKSTRISADAKVGLSIQTSRVEFSSKEVNDIRNSYKLKNPAATSYGEFSSLSTVVAEILIF